MVDQVEEIKSKVDIVEIVGDRVDLKKAGRNFKGLCPFHGEKTPSFMVSPERQSYKCFGCGEGGDVYTFLQRYEGMSFLEALESMAEKTGVKLERYKPTSQDLRRKKLIEIMHLASEYYIWILNNHKSAEVAREYLKARKIGGEARKVFGLGYAPDGWRQVSEFLIKKKKYEVEDLEAVGLVIKGDRGYYDRFRGRVMFPLRDHKGVVVGFSGRTLSSDSKDAKYINSPETPIYHKGEMLYGLYENREHIRKADEMVVVEGELDMIPSWSAGVRHVVAIKGSAFTEEQARLIARYTSNVVMALDADQAGEEAIKRAVNVAESMDMSIRVVQVEGGKDPGDVATESAKGWREMVEKSVTYYDFYIDSAKRRYVGDDAARKVSQEVVPILSGIENRVVQAHYVKKLARELSVPEQSVYDEIERVEKKRSLSKLRDKVQKIEEQKTSRRDQIEKRLLSIVLQRYESVKESLEEIEGEWIGMGAVRRVVQELKKWNEEKFEIAKFGQKLPAELQAILDECYMRDLEGIGDRQGAIKEATKLVREVETAYVRERLVGIGDEIESAERKGDDGRLEKLKREFAKLSTRLGELG